MVNWVDKIETAMEDCPTEDEILREKLEKEKLLELDTEVPASDTDP